MDPPPENNGRISEEPGRELVFFLEGARIFSDFTRESIEKLVHQSEMVDYPGSTTIIAEGETNSRVYFLLHGTISIFRDGEHILDLRRRGDIIGERCIVKNIPCPSTIVAKTAVNLVFIDVSAIRPFSRSCDHSLYNHLCRLFTIIMADKLTLTTRKAKWYEATRKELLAEVFKHQRAREKLRLSEEKYRNLIEMAPEPVAVICDAKIAYANPQALRALGMSRDELIQKPFYELIVPEERQRAMKMYEKRQAGKADATFEDRLISRTNGIRTVKGSAVPIDWEGRPGFLYYFTDITELKDAEQQVRQALTEKETLLQEVHHRVKNNLQVISSLIGMQALRTKDDQSATILEEIQHRIQSMAIAHESLYRSENLIDIPFENYVRRLVETLIQTYGSTDQPITVSYDFDDVTIKLEQAVACGLIVNELITNALKYAFAGKTQGELNISAKNRNPGLTLIIKDDGVGLPESINVLETNTMGFKIIQMFVSQLHAELEIVRENGTAFIISF